MTEDAWMRMIALLGAAILIVPAALARNRHTGLRNAAIWLAVLTALVVLYQAFGTP